MNQSFYQINGENVTIFFRKISTILFIFVFSEEKHELLLDIVFSILSSTGTCLGWICFPYPESLVRVYDSNHLSIR